MGLGRTAGDRGQGAPLSEQRQGQLASRGGVVVTTPARRWRSLSWAHSCCTVHLPSSKGGLSSSPTAPMHHLSLSFIIFRFPGHEGTLHRPQILDTSGHGAWKGHSGCAPAKGLSVRRVRKAEGALKPGGPRGGPWWRLLAVRNVHRTFLSLVTELFELERGLEPPTQHDVPASLAARCGHVTNLQLMGREPK